MSLTAALHTARTGISATQVQIAGTSDNIANALTPGFVAREARLTSLVLQGRGGGIDAEVIRGPTNSRLLRDMRFETARFAGFDYRAGAIEAFASLSGTPEDGVSLAASFGTLTTSFQGLRDAPDSPAAQRSVLDAARRIVSDFAAQEAGIREGREAADRDIANGVAAANDSLEQVARLNEEIVAGRAGDRDVSGLLDERDRQLSALSSLIGIRVAERPDGEVTVTTREGVTLLDGVARSISFSPVATIAPGMSLGAGLSGLSVDGIDITPTGGGPQAVASGQLAGAFEARDVDFVRFQRQIDELARQTLDLFQSADASVTAAPPTDTGLFTELGARHDPGAPPDPVPGLAGRLRINGAVDPSAGGDTAALRDGMHGAPLAAADTSQIDAFLSELTSQRAFSPAAGLDNDATLSSFAGSYVTGLGLARVVAEQSADGANLIRSRLEAAHVNSTGVNVDEESARLLELEQAYAANAQVVSTVSQMFDVLLANLG